MTGSIVLTVESSSPKEDAGVLQSLFPDRFDIEESSSEAIVLSDQNDKVTIFLIASEKSSRVIWVAEEEEILEASSRDQCLRMKILDYPIGEVRLESGASVILAPSDLFSSKPGRKLLMDRLSGSSIGPLDEAQPQEILPSFPSLQVKLLGQNGKLRQDFPLNSRAPVDFETELFKGKILFLLRPTDPEEDPYWNERLFSKKKRRIVVQIQGKFKREPKGVVYAGAEVSKPMKLGLMTRGLCSILLKLVESFNSNVHYSFGDNKGTEQAHIVVPAMTFFERLVATPPGATPPPLDELFEESKESIARRKKQQGGGSFSTESIYSFSFWTMYIDLVSWRLVDLPVSGDISLTTFWGDSLLRICMYEQEGMQKQHYQQSNEYAFALQIKYLGMRRSPDDESTSPEEDDDIIHWSGQRWSEDDVSLASMTHSESQIFTPPSVPEDSDDEQFFDAKEESPDVEYGERIPAVTVAPVAMELLSMIDSVCPCWVELCMNRGGHTSIRRSYAVNMGLQIAFRSVHACEELTNDNEAARIIDEVFSPRISSAERMRRMVGITLAQPERAKTMPGKVQSFRETESELGNTFLQRAKPSLSEKDKMSVRLNGFVARAISDRHWKEEYFKITNRSVSFYHPAKQRSRNFRITLPSVMKVERLAPENCPCFPDHYFLVVQTLGRSVYLMFGSEGERDLFLETLSRVKVFSGEVTNDSLSSNDSKFSAVEIDNPADEFLHRSSMWSCKNRRILNCAKFNLRVTTKEDDPLALVDDSLRRAMEPTTEFTEDFEQRRAFLDSAAALKRANVRVLPEDFRLCFFLNLYHVMIMHAYLVLGPPETSLKWISYFNNVAYEVSDDIFSLAELEHCIIRAKMSYPSQFVSRFVLPKSRYSFALTRADFRINFALNCGSVSNPPTVPIYRVTQLQEQLDATSRLFLESASVSLRSAREVVMLVPRICQWFSEDFGSHEELLEKIKPYVTESVQRVLNECWSPNDRRFDMKSVTIRYMPYSFECRLLTLETRPP